GGRARAGCSWAGIVAAGGGTLPGGWCILCPSMLRGPGGRHEPARGYRPAAPHSDPDRAALAPRRGRPGAPEGPLMYAAHFAAGLALRSRAPQAPTWALLTGAFVPDFLWIAFAVLGVEPTARAVFFDDWSHSLLTTLLWATLFAACFWQKG